VKQYGKILTLCLTVALYGTAATAAPILGAIDTWDAGTDAYQITAAGGSAAYGGLSNGGGYLQVLGGAATVSPFQDVIFDNLAANTLIAASGGNFGLATSLRFDFLVDAGTGVPDALSIYFSDIGSGATWYFDINTAALITGWNTDEGMDLDRALGWYRTTGVESDLTFATALASVDEVGWLLTYDFNEGGQIYGFDNLALDDETFNTPEPEVYAMLGFALLSLGIAFRRDLNDMLVQVGIG